MKYRRYLSLFVVILAVFALQACGSGGSAAPAGTAVVSLTDAPGDFDHVYITVKDIWLHTSDIADTSASGWLKYPLATPATVDLTTLSNGNIQSVWNNIQLPVGTYRQIRLFLVPTFSANPPSGHQYYNEVVIGSTTYPLHIPDADHGIALTGTFAVTAGGTIKLAIDFDAGHDIVEFREGADYVLKPRLACFDLDNAGAIIGKLSTGPTFTNTARFVIKAEQLFTDSTSTTMPTYHVIKRWTVPGPSGNFVLYPVSASTSTTYDIVVRGLNYQTVIIKGVPVAKGTTPLSGATNLGTIPMTQSSTPDYTIAGTITSPTGAWVQFYQTLQAAGEYPYEIRFRHFNPLWGGFRKTFELSSDQIQVGNFVSNGVVSAFTATSPAEGAGNFQAVAGAILFSRSTSTLVSSSTGTVSFPTPLTVIAPYQGNSVTGSVVLSNPGKMDGTMDNGLLFAVHGGMIVNSINIGTTAFGNLAPGGQITNGGTYTISNLPGGSSDFPLPGAFYGIDAFGWSSSPMPMSTLPYMSIAVPQVVDLSTANGSADMQMLPLW